MPDRYRRGVEIAHQLSPESLDKFCAGEVAEIAPDFARMVIEFTFGDLYAREELDLQTREIVAIAALASLGHVEQLRQHMSAALTAGLSRNKIIEILMQSAIYGGFPNALNALAECHGLLADDDCVGDGCG
jgi:4-carboxymuconolactone decarboxylase